VPPPGHPAPDAAASYDGAWRRVLGARRAGEPLVDGPWAPLLGPLLATPRCVVGQLGQSLDGRIATPTGASHYVNGPEAIVHLHRLRALVDAVVVGVGTALADDPALTVRHVEGPSPCRVVIDPRGRLGSRARLLADDGCRRIVVTGPDVAPDVPVGVEHVRIGADAGGRLSPAAIVDALAARGLARLLVEGGAFTVSAFLHARRLDRLHVAVAPLIIGSGPAGIVLPAIDRLDEALRPPVRIHPLGADVLWDLDLSSLRAP
jgi:riboflavin-specific deaminase-like protein